ncbi:hypothetical protein NPIL_701441 [Nephila pilipes]|uniref:Uncharacterized protein n=1 Tax=Nephila pilipes TaxID=299642 RepID=A0A8X6JMK0_NEPPI|nr:hypothetical protein NPIL_701441 [Nephila pilipes]
MGMTSSGPLGRDVARLPGEAPVLFPLRKSRHSPGVGSLKIFLAPLLKLAAATPEMVGSFDARSRKAWISRSERNSGNISLLDTRITAEKFCPGLHVGSDGGELLPGARRVGHLFHICGNPPEEVTVILTVREAHEDTKIEVGEHQNQSNLIFS